MIASTIWDNLADTLKNNPTLSEYVKNVYKGRRYDLEAESLPCIMMEPARNNETEKEFNRVKDIFFSVDIYAVSSANYHDLEKTIVGGLDYKGILDIENDLRACLQSSNTLGETVMDIRFDPTDFGIDEQSKFPVRFLVMPIRILYRQVDGA